jgi:AraC-like DNA-binding protein
MIRKVSLDNTDPLVEIKAVEILNISAQADIKTPCKANFLQIFWQIEGDTDFVIETDEVKLQASELIFIPENCVYHVLNSTRDRIMRICFMRSFYCSSRKNTVFLENSSLFNSTKRRYCKEIILFDTDIEIRIRGIGYIKKLINEKTPYALDLARNFLERLLLFAEIKEKMYQNKPDNTIDTECELVLKYEHLVAKNYKEIKNVEFYARELGVTHKRLTSSVKRLRGISAKTMICYKVILTAKRLLIYSEKSGKEISELLGFDNESAFSKFFSHYTNPSISPK